MGGGGARCRTRQSPHTEGIGADEPEVSGEHWHSGGGHEDRVRTQTTRAREATMPTFNVSVLTDEISQDLGRALEVTANEFGLGYVDLREVGKKNIMNWDSKEVAEV